MPDAHPDGSGAGPSTGVETLKQLKHAEVESEERLRQLVREGEAALSQLKTESEGAVHAVRAEVDRDRERTLQEARARAESEAQSVVADGERAAKLLRAATGKDLGPIKDQLLDIVLGEFRKGSGKPEA